MLRILMTTPGYSPAARMGGIAHSVPALAESLVSAGASVTVYTTNRDYAEVMDVPVGKSVVINGVDVVYFSTRSALGPANWIPYFGQSIGTLYSRDMKQAVRRRLGEFDVYHSQLPFTHASYLAYWGARASRRPYFYHQRGVLDPIRLQFRSIKKRIYYQLLEKRMLAYASGCFALTSIEAESYMRLGIPKDRIHVIPNGIDGSKYRATPRSDPLAPLGIPSDVNVLLYLGQLLPVKGIELAVDCFQRIAREFEGWHFVVAGPDPLGIQPRLNASLVDIPAVRDRVHFVGTVSGELKTDLLARADVFLLPSASEGFSMAVLEAMASETPVLVTAACGFPEIQEHGAGLVVTRSVEGVCDGLRTLMRSSAMRREMASAGRRLAESQFTWARVAEGTLRAYAAAVQGLGGSD